MLGMKPRNDMRYTAYYYDVTDYEEQDYTLAPQEFRYGKRKKKQSSFNVVENFDSVGVDEQYITDSTIDFKVDGKISSTLIIDLKELEDANLITMIDFEYDKGNLSGDKWGNERGRLQVLDVT